jgi:hypothetical protein
MMNILARLRALLGIESAYDVLVAVFCVLMFASTFVLYIQHDQRWTLLWPGLMVLGAFIGLRESFLARRRGDRRVSLGLASWNLSMVILASVFALFFWDGQTLSRLPLTLLYVLFGVIFILQATAFYFNVVLRDRTSNPGTTSRALPGPSQRKMPPIL